MRKGFAVLGVSVVGFSALGFALTADDGIQQRQAPVVVTIDVRCPGQSVQYTVDPWEVSVRQGDRIEWRLSEGSTADEFAIESKTQEWPFEGSRGVSGRKASPAVTPNMRPNQRGRRYQYNIRLTCQSESRSVPVLIDPDIIIRDE